MKYIRLGHSDLTVSRICLGCMGFGDAAAGMHAWTLPEDASRAILRQALDAGINFFDTAMAYQGGTSEMFVGRALRDFARREDVVLATKFHPRPPQAIEAGISFRQHVSNMLDASLKRLGMDYVDLYILHAWDNHTPVEEIMEGMNAAVTSGKVRAIGVSNCYAWQLAKANEIAKANGWAQFVSIQGHHNLIFREEEREMLPYCRAHRVATTPYSALAAGRLSRLPGETSNRLQLDKFAMGKYDATAVPDEIIIRRVHEIATAHETSMTTVSLAWLLTKVTAPVVGATKPHHISGAVAAVDLQLTPEEIAYLEEPYIPHKLVGVMAQSR